MIELTPENSKTAAALQALWLKLLPQAPDFRIKKIEIERRNDLSGGLIKTRRWIVKDPKTSQCYDLGATERQARLVIREFWIRSQGGGDLYDRSLKWRRF